jgi:hypothetical protein
MSKQSKRIHPRPKEWGPLKAKPRMVNRANTMPIISASSSNNDNNNNNKTNNNNINFNNNGDGGRPQTARDSLFAPGASFAVSRPPSK